MPDASSLPIIMMHTLEEKGDEFHWNRAKRQTCDSLRLHRQRKTWPTKGSPSAQKEERTRGKKKKNEGTEIEL